MSTRRAAGVALAGIAALAVPVLLPDNQSRVTSTGISSMGTGAGSIVRQEFECRASYSGARLTPIELSIPR